MSQIVRWRSTFKNKININAMGLAGGAPELYKTKLSTYSLIKQGFRAPSKKVEIPAL